MAFVESLLRLEAAEFLTAVLFGVRGRFLLLLALGLEPGPFLPTGDQVFLRFTQAAGMLLPARSLSLQGLALVGQVPLGGRKAGGVATAQPLQAFLGRR